MKRQFRAYLSAFLLCAALAPAASAEDVDTSNHPDTVRAFLAPYTFGVGVGAISAINSELAQESEVFLKLSVAQMVRFGRHLALGMDLDWFAPGTNWGGDMSLNFLMGSATFKPFVGAGVGIHYFDTGDNFGQGLGPSGLVHAGLLFNVTEEMQARVRVPFHYVANKQEDRGVGLDIAILFGSPLRSVRVKKLVY